MTGLHVKDADPAIAREIAIGRVPNRVDSPCSATLYAVVLIDGPGDSPRIQTSEPISAACYAIDLVLKMQVNG